LTRVERKLDVLLKREEREMAIGDDILAKVTEEGTKIDGVIALITGLRNAGTIAPETATAILTAIQGSEDKLDAALGANTTPA